MERVVKGFRPKVLPSRESAAPNGYCALMRQCWHQNPTARPEFSEIAKKVRILLESCPKDKNVHEIMEESHLSEGDVLPLRVAVHEDEDRDFSDVPPRPPYPHPSHALYIPEWNHFKPSSKIEEIDI
jgi:hypothetical protein